MTAASTLWERFKLLLPIGQAMQSIQPANTKMSDDPLAQWVNQGHSSPMTDRGSASVVQIDSGKLVPLIIVLAILCGMALSVSAMVYQQLSEKYAVKERETRMLEYYLLELDAKFINAGLKDPSEAISKKLQQQRESEQ